MYNRINILKGINPGKVIERELKKRNITQRQLAEETDIPYQTINAIIGGRRNLTTSQALKIEEALKYEEGFLLILQSFYEIKLQRDKELTDKYPTPPRIRKSIFWDADFNNINWGKHKQAVITRVLERGSDEEVEEIKRYYNVSERELRQYKPKIVRTINKKVNRSNG